MKEDLITFLKHFLELNSYERMNENEAREIRNEMIDAVWKACTKERQS